MISDVDYQSDVRAAEEGDHYRTQAEMNLTVEDGWLGYHRHEPEQRENL